MLNYPIIIVRDIILKEMELTDEQIIIYNQKYNIPENTGLHMAVRFNNTKVYSNRINYKDVNGNFSEVQDLNTQEFYTVRMISQNLEAFQRKEQVAMALNSTYAQQQMEKFSFQISNVNPAIDVSENEASSRLYRFDIDIVVLASYQKVKTVDFYDQFTGELLTEKARIDFVQQSI